MLHIEKKDIPGTELPAKIYLFQGLPKADKMELIIQKAVELGAFQVIPVAMKRCVVKLDEKKAEKKETAVEARKSEDGIYSTSEWVNDVLYYRYNKEEELYQKMKKFVLLLQSTDQFTYVTQIGHQGIVIEGIKIPDKFLMYYEMGNSEYSRWEDREIPEYDVKALYVSQSFFEKNQIAVAEGRSFMEADYSMEPDEVIPVLLGSDYREIFQIGDCFSGQYFTQDSQFEVIGFLEEDSFFVNRNSIEPESTRRYMVTPAFLECDGCDFASILLLQETVGLIYSEGSYEQIKEQYNQLIKEAGVEEFELIVNDPNENFDYNEEIQRYAYMTREITDQYQKLFWIIFLLVVICFYLVVRQSMEENRYRYSVMMLNGASIWWIVAEIVCQITVLVLPAALMANIRLSMLITVYDRPVILNSKCMLWGVSGLLIVLVGLSLAVYSARTSFYEEREQ